MVPYVVNDGFVEILQEWSLTLALGEEAQLMSVLFCNGFKIRQKCVALSKWLVRLTSEK